MWLLGLGPYIWQFLEHKDSGGEVGYGKMLVMVYKNAAWGSGLNKSSAQHKDSQRSKTLAMIRRRMTSVIMNTKYMQEEYFWNEHFSLLPNFFSQVLCLPTNRHQSKSWLKTPMHWQLKVFCLNSSSQYGRNKCFKTKVKRAGGKGCYRFPHKDSTATLNHMHWFVLCQKM